MRRRFAMLIFRFLSLHDRASRRIATIPDLPADLAELPDAALVEVVHPLDCVRTGTFDRRRLGSFGT